MLTSGSLFSGYEVLGRLGAGGMGEVYRARDKQLGREVALKLLPDELALDPGKRRRFEREARSLAAFHHPGIVTLYGFEEADGILCLVMELVEGPTLADRLMKGRLPLPEALRVAAQVAEALEAAHERGILHRDLKPSNIKITTEGRVKLIDFGLAKGLEAAEPDAMQSEKSTASEDPTGFGVVVGTAPYMSPEQARCEVLDHRTDVWAFGCVLYEMLTGQRAFPGNNRMEAVAAVLAREPDWDALPRETPQSIRKLLKRALEKDRAHRLHDIGDARLEIEEAFVDLSSGGTAAPAARTVPRRSSKRLWIAALLSVTTVIAVAVWLLLRASGPAPPTVTHLTIAPPAGVKFIGAGESAFQHLALAPLGDRAAFVGSFAGKERLYLQAINDIEARAIPNTEGAHSPFFSPDGRWLGYWQGNQLKKALLDGGAPLTIADLPQVASLRGASWGEDGTIVFCPGPYEGLWRVPANGGRPTMITTPDTSQNEESHRWPQILPGSRDVLFSISTGFTSARIGLLSLETGRWRVLFERTGFARYSPTGHIIFARLGTLYAEPFDLSQLAVTGSAVPVLDDVQMVWSGHFYADFDISRSGALLYVPGFPHPVERSLFWVDRQGRTSPAMDSRQAYEFARLSPDGRQVSVTISSDPERLDQWVFDLKLGSGTLAAGKAGYGIWSPDGQWLAAVNADEELVKIRVDGSSPLKVLSEPLGLVTPDAWSPDGRIVVLSQQFKDTVLDIKTLPADGGKPALLLATPNVECCSALSPDGRFIAYTSNESGSLDIYVSPFPGPMNKRYRISTEGGIQPLFSRDGRELFYRGLGDRPKFMSASIETRRAFQAGTPRPLFDDTFAGRTRIDNAHYDISSDGLRFLFVEEPPAAPGPTRLVLIPDWASEIRTRMRAAQP